jgi:hypothetical protein
VCLKGKETEEKRNIFENNVNLMLERRPRETRK